MSKGGPWRDAHKLGKVEICLKINLTLVVLVSSGRNRDLWEEMQFLGMALKQYQVNYIKIIHQKWEWNRLDSGNI